MKQFNVTGTCYPDDHYMVDISDRLDSISKYVADGQYITINRGRQYGKTTTIFHLVNRLKTDYVVFSISFEALGENNFQSKESLAYSFLEQMRSTLKYANKDIDETIKTAIIELLDKNSESKQIDFTDLSDFISEICSESTKPIVVIIDEVDNASNYNSFIEFLRHLRYKYLNRMTMPTFQSVILAGVYDIKNLKFKVRPDADHQYNSPWNIAMAFTEDMSFSASQIAQMLCDYEADHQTGMDIDAIATLIEDYTSGYPFFVSKICKLIDDGKLGWNKEGVIEAVNLLLKEKNTFFDDIYKKLEDFPQMRNNLKNILYGGYEEPFNIYNNHIEIAAMFNYIKDVNGKVRVSNRIIETWLYNLFITEEEIDSRLYDKGSIEKNQFIDGKELKMDKILERFAIHFNDIYGSQTQTFREEEGRRLFMLYVRPIINGTGNYYIEAETRDRSRTDMIIDYLGQQYIIEMKIWRGESYNERGERQLTEYLDYYHTNRGYLLSFCFNQNKQLGVWTIKIADKEIIEVVV